MFLRVGLAPPGFSSSSTPQAPGAPYFSDQKAPNKHQKAPNPHPFSLLFTKASKSFALFQKYLTTSRPKSTPHNAPPTAFCPVRDRVHPFGLRVGLVPRSEPTSMGGRRPRLSLRRLSCVWSVSPGKAHCQGRKELRWRPDS